jgi:hypothetical protein
MAWINGVEVDECGVPVPDAGPLEPLTLTPAEVRLVGQRPAGPRRPRPPMTPEQRAALAAELEADDDIPGPLLPHPPRRWAR